ncbi:multicopper oxidase family protein [Ancylobacter lacus]|uniref:multicopper oxidase family protein n=1 Tax=Ancylobacter lacus TaxID=2579970 RepID=UPI001BD157DF|nr:multicopper oxidase family protein [Ancylobacter lacus]MBS7538499.1 multicopper oxidase family protein [Ancylobacter lacus]
MTAASATPAGQNGVIVLPTALIIQSLPGLPDVSGAGRETRLGFGTNPPAPTLRARAGASAALSLESRIDEPVALGFGGLALPQGPLGVPGFGPELPAGGQFDIRLYPAESGTYLISPYNPHQLARGLAAALVVEGPQDHAVDREHVLLIQDRRAAEDGPVQLTVNGQTVPELPAGRGERVRLRLLNATRGLFLPLKLDAPCFIVAIDGRPAEPFRPAEGRLPLAPGGRLEVLVDIDEISSDGLPLAVETAAAPRPLARLMAVEAARTGPAWPAPPPLRPAVREPALRHATRLDLAVPERPAPGTDAEPMARVRRGTTLAIGIRNPTQTPAILRLYGLSARLLDALDDGWKPWWQDCVMLWPGSTTRLALVAERPGRWPLVIQRTGDAAPLRLAWFEATR